MKKAKKLKKKSKTKKEDRLLSEVFFRQPSLFLINIKSGKCTAQQLLGKPITTYKHISDTIRKLEAEKIIIRGDQSKKQWGGKPIFLTAKGVKLQDRLKNVMKLL